jgi:hypothetical protein
MSRLSPDRQQLSPQGTAKAGCGRYPTVTWTKSSRNEGFNYGTGAAYLVRRLKRDRPDLAEALPCVRSLGVRRLDSRQAGEPRRERRSGGLAAVMRPHTG